MMGSTHAQSATTAWAAATMASPIVGVHPHWTVVAFGTLACAGAGLLPDADHPSATIAHSFGPVSEYATKLIHRLSGGHRQATHSLLFAAACYAGTWGLLRAGGSWAAMPILFVLFTFGLRALRLVPGLSYGVAAAATAAACFFLQGQYGWIPAAVVIGVLAHLGGDCLTHEGCPVFWPWATQVRLPLISRTGNRLEMRLFGPAFALGTLVIYVFVR